MSVGNLSGWFVTWFSPAPSAPTYPTLIAIFTTVEPICASGRHTDHIAGILLPRLGSLLRVFFFLPSTTQSLQFQWFLAILKILFIILFF
jgi:hypothetical protein